MKPFNTGQSTASTADNMDNFSERLLSAARRYCVEQFDLCTEKYDLALRACESPEENVFYGERQSGTLPRCDILETIQAELERMTGQDLGTAEEAREAVALAGLIAEDQFLKYVWPVATKAREEELQLFFDFVFTVSENELYATPLLPYRRVLSREETDRLTSQVSLSWPISDYHYWDMFGEKEHDRIKGFDDVYFFENIPVERLRQILSSRNVDRLFHLGEYELSYELDSVYLDPWEGGRDFNEGFWFSNDPDWILYSSIDGGIVIGGWLLDEVRTAWPDNS